MPVTSIFTYVNDADVSSFMNNISDYESKVVFLGNSYQIATKNKIYGNKQGDWNTADPNDPSYIKNKPTVISEETDPTVPSYVKAITASNISFWDNKQDAILDINTIRENAEAGANKVSNVQGDWNVTDSTSQSYIKNKPVIVSAETDPTVPAHVKTITTGDISNWNSKVSNIQPDWDATTGGGSILNKPDISRFFDDVEYDSTNKTINFKHGNTVKDSIDATDFIKDGMVDSAYLGKGTTTGKVGKDCLIITFNTDAGKEDIEILLADIFNPENYYDMSSADELFATISSLDDYVTKNDLTAQSYLKSFTETDPTVPAYVKSITQADINNWNTYGNVQADWNATSGDAFIKNKPAIPVEVTESTVIGWGFTKNIGTITGITMNGSSKGTSGIVDLGTVLTAHQDISGKQDTITDLETIRSNASVGAAKVSANDSTITIQKGGSTVDTFTTNASSNKTINIPNELPSYSSSDSGKILSVNSSGQLVWITPVSIYTGSGEPANSLGNDGDIYLQS